MKKIERYAKAFESVMPNLEYTHEMVVDAISRSDFTIGGMLANVNNLVYPIGNVNYAMIKRELEKELQNEDN